VTSTFVVLDIETVLDPELPIAQAVEAERLPAPPHHRIVAIGALLMDASYAFERLGLIGDVQDERGALADFARFFEERKPCLVTFNGRGFDIPVILARCLRHGISLRHYCAERDVRHRYSPDRHLDLMDFVADYGASRPSRLDVVAKLCGMPGKLGVEGKDVGPLIHAGKYDEVRNYCLCDVVQTAAVFLRVQLVRGEISRENYKRSMQALLDVIKSDTRLSPVALAMDESRLMLAEVSAEKGEVSNE
jgi:3'-5' exonuclease